jgi:glycosyltransferase involved in cell wall biosynthesis
MNAAPPISVLLSVRNGLPYVTETISSICQQSFGDFELVIVDNCSEDGTRDLLHAAKEKDSRLRVLLNEKDLGHSGGLNRGLSECRAAWVARIDADDIALPERLECQWQFHGEYPTAGAFSCLAHYIDPTGKRVGKTFHDLKSPADFARYVERNEMIGILHPGAFLDRELVLKIGGYREPFKGCNDIDLWARIAETGRCILVQQKYLVEYRVHPAQGTAKFMENRLRYEWARACASARRGGKSEPSWEEFLQEWNKTPWLHRVNRSRKARAKYFYRQGGLDYACGKPIKAAVELAGAILLQPGYAMGRLLRQWPAKS